MGQIQNSMNQLFAASMGMGYAISQHPATKNYVENKQLNKKGEAAGKAFTEFANKATDGSLGTDEILTDIAADMSKKSYKDRVESAQTPEQFKKAFEGRLDNEKQINSLRESLEKQRKAEAPAEEAAAEKDDTLELLKELGVDVDNINVGGVQYAVLAIVGVIISVVAQIGDLTMSQIKRKFGVKDYGKIMPGHGGVLDRFDSIIAVAFVLVIACAVVREFGLSVFTLK